MVSLEIQSDSGSEFDDLPGSECAGVFCVAHDIEIVAVEFEIS